MATATVRHGCLTMLIGIVGSCGTTKPQPGPITLSPPVIQGYLSTHEESTLHRVMDMVLADYPSRFRIPWSDKTVSGSPICAMADCLISPGKKSGATWVIGWAIDRRDVMWVGRTFGLEPVGTASGNKHAPATIEGPGGDLEPTSAPTATWRFKIQLIHVSNRTLSGDFREECSECTVLQAAEKLRSLARRTLATLTAAR